MHLKSGYVLLNAPALAVCETPACTSGVGVAEWVLSYLLGSERYPEGGGQQSLGLETWFWSAFWWACCLPWEGPDSGLSFPVSPTT